MRYFLRRIGFFIATLWAAVTLNFIIPRLQPGDPAEIMFKKLQGKDAELDPAKIEALRAMLGDPAGANLWDQYWNYLGSLARGDFGISYTYFPYEVKTVIGVALPWTLVLVGVTHDDTAAIADALADKIWNLRILHGERSCADAGAPIMVVSQFTLYADTRKGRRPSWSAAAPGPVSAPLVEAFVSALRGRGAEVSTGRFGAMMDVSLVNDGPMTIVLELGTA